MEKSIVELLKDDHEYYNGVGRKLLSNSNIEMMTRTPELFLRFINGEYTPESKTHFVMGNAAHTMILEGEGVFDEKFNILDVATRNNKTYQESEFAKDTLLLTKERDLIYRLRDKLVSVSLHHDDVFNLVTRFTGDVEVPNVINIYDADWKLKVDKVTDDYIYDFKTTSDLSKFLYVAKKYNYDAQAYLYSHVFQKEMKFIVIDKLTLEVAVVDCGQSFLESGRQKIEDASNYYNSTIKPVLDGATLEVIHSACEYQTLI